MPTSARGLRVRLDGVATGKRIRFTATLQNNSGQDLIVVRDKPSVLGKAGSSNPIELRVAETQTPELMFYYWYTPIVGMLAPGESRTERFLLVARGRGKLRFRLTWGYIEAPFIPVSADPRGDFVQQQRLARSNVVEVSVR